MAGSVVKNHVSDRRFFLPRVIVEAKGSFALSAVKAFLPRARITRASTVFRFLPSLLHLCVVTV